MKIKDITNKIISGYDDNKLDIEINEDPTLYELTIERLSENKEEKYLFPALDFDDAFLRARAFIGNRYSIIGIVERSDLSFFDTAIVKTKQHA
jgi:hypothetical protein